MNTSPVLFVIYRFSVPHFKFLSFPGGVNIDCKVVPSQTEEGVYECLYIAPKVGQYVINITFGGQHITKSPFRVDVGPEKTSKIVAYGPGLEGGVVNQPACFTVETNGETGALGKLKHINYKSFG